LSDAPGDEVILVIAAHMERPSTLGPITRTRTNRRRRSKLDRNNKVLLHADGSLRNLT
jgi:hypothetical protein